MNGLRMILGTLAATAAAAASAASAAELPAALHACAAIAADAARLACYDRLAGRDATPAAAQAAPAQAAPVPLARAPAPAASASAAAAAAAAAAVPAKPSFGLYPAEHPRPPPVAKSLTARVAELGTSAGGRTTVTLEGGQLWELDDPDPLLAVGDTVTITRASFGSFMMQTPTRRTHRVQRLR